VAIIRIIRVVGAESGCRKIWSSTVGLPPDVGSGAQFGKSGKVVILLTEFIGLAARDELGL
jgi:hypothetical protein